MINSQKAFLLIKILLSFWIFHKVSFPLLPEEFQASNEKFQARAPDQPCNVNASCYLIGNNSNALSLKSIQINSIWYDDALYYPFCCLRMFKFQFYHIYTFVSEKISRFFYAENTIEFPFPTDLKILSRYSIKA